jgi:NitT/TauT family transport system substrate-binding protein
VVKEGESNRRSIHFKSIGRSRARAPGRARRAYYRTVDASGRVTNEEDGMKRRWPLLALLLVALLALAAAGCGGDDDDDERAGGGGTQTLTATIPFPSGAVFYPLYVAEANGYTREEGISLQVQPVDGSDAGIQQVLSGQADIALSSAGNFFQAVQRGADLVAVYTLYQGNVFSIQAPADSAINRPRDLEGDTLGIGSLGGGETPFARAVMAAAGLEEREDYKLLAVGDGGPASVAMKNGDIAAYAASFPDVAIMRLRGLELKNIVPENFASLFDSLFVMKRDFVEDNPDVIEGLGRAVAKATVWGFENQEATIEITSKKFPEEAEDKEFSLALLRETQSLFELPEEADGKYGTAVPETVDFYIDFLVDQGELKEEGDLADAIVANDHVDEYNDFDEEELSPS